MMPVSSGENVACTTIANSSTGAAFQAQMSRTPRQCLSFCYFTGGTERARRIDDATTAIEKLGTRTYFGAGFIVGRSSASSLRNIATLPNTDSATPIVVSHPQTNFSKKNEIVSAMIGTITPTYDAGAAPTRFISVRKQAKVTIEPKIDKYTSESQ